MAEQRLVGKRHRILRQVGRGGMGAVYEVLHEKLNVVYGLKRLITDLEGNPEIERRFLEEAQRMARLRHEHIVRVFDIDHEPDFGVYFIMEFIRGPDLGHLLRTHGKLSLPETLRIGKAVASALECAHNAGLVHRDIKPANILIEEGTGRPVVTDFGIAKEIESAASDDSFTKTGAFIGTYRYSSREQIRNERSMPIDGRADIYSLGAVLYECASGSRFLAELPEATIPSYVGYSDGWRVPLAFAEQPPDDFVAMIADCVAIDRDERIASATELLERIEGCRSALEPSPRATPVVGLPRRPVAPPAEVRLATSAEPATAITVPQPEDTSGEADARARSVALLQTLRDTVDDSAGEFQRLLKELIELGLPRDDYNQLDDMSQILHRVERAEREGQYQDAAANLQDLSARIQRLNGEIEQSIAAALERGAVEVRAGLQELASNAGNALDRDLRDALEQSLSSLADRLAADEWEECRATLVEARRRLEEARLDARARASGALATPLGELRALVAAMRSRTAGTSVDVALDPEEIARLASDAIEHGAFDVARGQVEEALASARSVSERLEREEDAAITAARATADAARDALGADDARELAPVDLAAAERAYAGATEEARRGAKRAAASGFMRAAELYAAAAEATRRAAAAQIEGAERRLRAMLADLEDAPEEVVGEHRSAALRALGGERQIDRRDAVAELEAAGSALRRAATEIAPYREARAAGEAAERAREQAIALGVDERELGPASALRSEAEAALANREFVAAGVSFREAQAALEQASRAAIASSEVARLDEEWARIDAGLAELDVPLARELCGRQIESVRRTRERAAKHAGRGDRGRALAENVEGLAALESVRDDVLAGARKRGKALVEEIEALATHCGALLANDERETLLDQARSVLGALDRRELHASVAGLTACARSTLRARDGVIEKVRAAVEADLVRLGDALGALSALGGSEPRPEIAPDGVRGRTDVLLREQRYLEAYELSADALRQAEAALAAERQAQREAMDAARSGAARARQRLDRNQAALLLGEESLREADDAFAAAERARDAEQLRDAAAAYGSAEEAVVALQGRVRETQLALYDRQKAQLEDVLRRADAASEEIVGSAREAARARIDATVVGDLTQAIEDVREEQARLERVLAEAEQHAASLEAQAAARAAQQRVATLAPTRRAVKGPTALLRDADAAFRRRDWGEAARRYEKARESLVALEREVDADRAAKAPVAVPTPADEPAPDVAVPRPEAAVEEPVVPRQPPVAELAEVPSEVPARRGRAGVGLAVGAAALVAIGALVLWIGGREPTPAKLALAPEGALAPAAGGAAKGTAVRPAAPRADEAAPAPAPKQEVASVPPPAPAVPPLRIASFTPADSQVTVDEGKKQGFGVEVTGGPDATEPKIAWRLDDRVVASDTARFEYAPALDAANGKSRTLEVVVGEGKDAVAHRWDVAVANVNQKPTLATTPKTGTKIDAKLGDSVKLTAKASDADGDSVKYAWTIDGQAAASDGPELMVPVTGDRKVSVKASDGTASVDASWQIVAIKPTLQLTTTPAKLERLRFEKPQEFAVAVPADAANLDLAWSVDGRKVASGPRFSFANDDPGLVRRAPVEIALSAAGADGATFKRSWKVIVEPPEPKVVSVEPPAGEIEAESGASQTFAITSERPVGAQDLSYVFEVDGAVAAKGESASFSYRVPDDKPHRIVAYLRDNFDQTSRKTEWKLSPGSDIVRRAEAWLAQYRSALNAKDAARIVSLRGVADDVLPQLQKALSSQRDLKVDIDDVAIKRIDDRSVQLTYTRTDSFVDDRTSAPISQRVQVEQELTLDGGKLRETRSRLR